jgi:hypothetical protein
MRLAGNVPMRNGREIDRLAIARMYGWDSPEIYKAAQSFKAMHRRQPESTITEFKSLMSVLARRRTKRECPHCKRLFSPGMFAAWHGDKCKSISP